MAKDILLFGHIWSANALYFFEQLKEALDDDPEADITLRINTNGGEPDYAMAVVEKIQEIKDQVTVKAGMSAHSAGLFAMMAVDSERVECNDLTQCVLHRIAYPEWVEGSESFKGSVHEEMVVKSNKKFEKMVRDKVDVAALEALPQMKDKNITLKDVFSMEQRLDVVLTATDLKKLGIVSKVNKITPSKKSEMVAMSNAFEKCRDLNEFKMAASSQEKPKPNSGNMELTLENLKSDHPVIYNAVVEAAKKEGKEAEVARVKAWAAWAKVDPDRVAKAIAEGTEMSIEVISELSAKAASVAAVAAVAAGNPGADAGKGKGKGKEGAAAPAAEAGEGTKEKVTGDQELESLSADVDKYLGKKPVTVASKEHAESDEEGD